MTEPITLEQLKNASLDAETLEQFISGAPNATIKTRLGRMLPTIASIVQLSTTDNVTQGSKTQREINNELIAVIENIKGGYFAAYDTLAKLQKAQGMTTGQIAKVMNDPIATNNGDYIYDGEKWVKGYGTTDTTSGQLFNLYSSNVNLDKVNKQLVIPAARLVYDNGSIMIQDSTTALPTDNGVYRIEYDLVGSAVRIVLAAAPQPRLSIRFAKLLVDNENIDTYKLFGVDHYQINGAKAIGASSGTLVAASESDINFDFTNKNLIIAANQVRLVYDRTTVLLPAFSIDLDTSTSYWQQIIYNYATGELSCKRTNLKLIDTEIRVGFFNASLEKVFGIAIYQINGEGYGTTDTTSGQLFNLYSSNVNLDKVNKQLVIPAARLVYDNGSIMIQDSTTALPTDNGVYRIEYDLVGSAVRIVLAAAPQPRLSIRFAKLLVDNENIDTYKLFGVDHYQINGAKAIGASSGTLVAASESDINFDFTNKNLIIAANQVRLVYDRTTVLLPAFSIDLDTSTSYWQQIIYNYATGELSCKRTNLKLIDTEIRVGFFNASLEKVFGIAIYQINGEGYGTTDTTSGQLFNLYSSNVNLDKVNKQLVIPAARLVYDNGSIMIQDSTTALPTDNGVYRIEYDLVGSAVRIVLAAAPQPRLSIRFAKLLVDNENIDTYKLFGVDHYQINGAKAIGASSGTLVAASESDINFDFTNKNLIIAANQVRLVYDRTTVLLPAFSIDLDTSTSYWQQIIYNYATGELSYKRTNLKLRDTEIRVGFFNASLEKVFGIAIYQINGEGYGTTDTTSGQLFNLYSSNVNLDKVNKQLVIPAARLVYDNGSIMIQDSTTALPTDNGVYRIEYDLVGSAVRIVLAAAPQPRLSIRFAKLLVINENIDTYKLFGVDHYQINGAKAIGASSGTLVAASESDINFDFTNKNLIIAANQVRLVYDRTTVLLPAFSIDLDTSTSYWQQIIYNYATGELSYKRTNLKLRDTEIRVGFFNASLEKVFGIAIYQINGASVGNVSNVSNDNTTSHKTDIVTSLFTAPYYDVNADYEQTTDLSAYSDIVAADNGDYTKVIARYDALVASYPDYITKSDLGAATNGTRIYQYRFNTKDVRTVDSAKRKPKIIIISGVHGYERAAIYNVYFTMREICEKWATSKHLESLKYGVDFIVIPIANPTAYNGGSRKNANGVDIARNFPTGWKYTADEESLYYAGTNPLSEPETVIINNVMAANTDALCFCDHHNFGEESEPRYLWLPSATRFGVSLAQSLIASQTQRAKKRYAWMPQTDDYHIGWVRLGPAGGSAARHATYAHGIQGTTFESCYKFMWEKSPSLYSSATATIGVESFINWLLLNVKYATQFYNTRTNL